MRTSGSLRAVAQAHGERCGGLELGVTEITFYVIRSGDADTAGVYYGTWGAPDFLSETAAAKSAGGSVLAANSIRECVLACDQLECSTVTLPSYTNGRLQH